MNAPKIPAGTVALFMASVDRVWHIMDHWERHEENHECGYWGCRQCGFRASSDFEYNKATPAHDADNKKGEKR